jgi:hypothetical protein
MKKQLLKTGMVFILSGLLISLLLSCSSTGQISGELEKGFLNPSIENRPLAFYDWLNGYVDTARLVLELEEMKNKGMQGAFIWDVGALADPEKIIPAGPTFLGEESLNYISIALETGAKLGLNLGMIASSSWNAGGDWIGEEDASKELLIHKQQIIGPSAIKITIGKPEGLKNESNLYSLVSTIAVLHSDSDKLTYSRDEAICLDEFITDSRFIEWDAPEGQWDVISFFMCNTGQNLECPSPNSNGYMIDHLSQRATQRHFDTIISRLDRISTAENQLKFLEVDSYEVWPAKDWTPGFIVEFTSRYGYDPRPYLPLLKGYACTDSIVGERFMGDYNRLVSDLIIENHFAQSVSIANKHNMKMFAEAGHGGYPRVDPLKALGNSDIPMGEFWNGMQFWVTREAASAAHIYGKKVVASESLTGWNHWQHGPTDYKQLFDVAFCQGLNQVFFHTFAHNPEIAGKPGFAYHAGEHINVNTTWWEMARPFMDYLSRCSYLLRQGNFVADACLYYGDQAPNLVPPKRIDPNVVPKYSDDQCLHCGLDKPVNPGDLEGYDYDYMNADIITTTLSVEDGKLILPSGISYRVLLLPDRLDISLEVLKSIQNLVFEGATVIGRKPERTTSLKNFPECDEEVKSIASELWGDIDGEKIFSNAYGEGKVYWGKSVKEVLEEMDVKKDLSVEGIDNSNYIIDFIHRKTENEEIYFISNSSKEQQDITCTFRVPSKMIPELWDAESGLIQREVNFTRNPDGITMELILDPLASRFVVFRKKSKGQNDPDLRFDLQYGYENPKVEGSNHQMIDISDNWHIQFDPEMGGPPELELQKLYSWSDMEEDGIKYYSGTASYSRSFKISKDYLNQHTSVFLDFEDIQEIARVIVNGQDCGIIWTPPFRKEISKHLISGENKITIMVANTWKNRIIGDKRNPGGPQFTSTNVKYKFSPNAALLPSGLIGRAQIIISKN